MYLIKEFNYFCVREYFAMGFELSFMIYEIMKFNTKIYLKH